MVKTIVVTETIGSGVVGWVDVNEFDLPVELLFEGMEGDEVVAFDDEVLANDTVFVSFKVANLIFIMLIMNYPPPIYFCR